MPRRERPFVYSPRKATMGSTTKGAARRNVAGRRRDAYQKCRNAGEAERIGRRHVVQERPYDRRHGKRAGKANHDTHRSQLEALSDDESQHITSFGTERDAHADLLRSL